MNDNILPTKKEKNRNEFLYFALRNRKLQIGLAVILFFLILAIFGPYLTDYKIYTYVNPTGPMPPNSEYWFGTTFFGQDVFTQVVHGLRSAFMVGVLGGGIGTLVGMIIGFTAGYSGGVVDEILNAFTNIVLVIPTLAVLLIIAAYLDVRSLFMESIFIGITAWPWVARAVRAQTFSLRSREFIDLARLSGVKPIKIIITEIAPNMMSYLVMSFILQFGGAILNAATLDFIGLGPTNAISLGMIMQYAVQWGALQFGMWWWFVPPGLAITAMVGALYFMNVGLDEVFNPKLRET